MTTIMTTLEDQDIQEEQMAQSMRITALGQLCDLLRVNPRLGAQMAEHMEAPGT